MRPNLSNMTPIEVEERVLKARSLFSMGYNCSQAVFAACSDAFGISDQELALRISASFGGGIGRMRKTCGAACGMFMLEGLRSGCALAGNAEGKMRNYSRVRQLADIYRAQFGSTTCATLLANGKVPCADMVAEAVRIVLTAKLN